VAGKIFINYRRGEDQKDAQHLATLLGRQFGDKRIFIDVRGIDGGDQWLHTLEKQVAASDAMIALIGKGWLELKDDEGNRRLDNAHDFVRFEISQALQRNIPILPVLLDGAQMPKAAQLPPNIIGLLGIQATRLRSESVVLDSEAIARQLKGMVARRRSPGIPAWAAAAGGVIILAVGVAVGAYGLGSFGTPAPPSELRAQVDAAKGELAKTRAEADERLGSALQERDAARNALANANQRVVDLQTLIDAANNDIAKVRADAERLRRGVQERDEARSVLANANQRIADLQKAIDAANSDIAKTRDEVERLRPAMSERDEARSALANANQRITDLQKVIETANSDIANARADAERLRPAVQERDEARSLLANANQRAANLQKEVEVANNNLAKVREEAKRLRLAALERGQAVAELSEVTAAPTSAASAIGTDPARAVTPGSGQSFRDNLANGEACQACPDMVIIPPGSFQMGVPPGESERHPSEGPQHRVAIHKSFAVGRLSITRAEFSSFVRDSGHRTEGGCSILNFNSGAFVAAGDSSWQSPGFAQEDQHPAVCISWHDAKAYVTWLSGKTNKPYRLLTEAEREYAARAGTTSAFWVGARITPSLVNYNSQREYSPGSRTWRRQTLPAGSLAANPWGLYNVHGNVWEWTEDCWTEDYTGASNDAAANTKIGDCNRRVVRGGSWANGPGQARSGSRAALIVGIRQSNVGLRLARDVAP
jgi:formylglycine-generating enzyme required for sulfatase activity